MADVEVWDWLEPVLGAVGGQPWPQLSESALVRESEVWEEFAGFVRELEGRFSDPAYAAVATMEGDGAAALKASLDRFVKEIGADQELPAFQQIAQYMQDTADGLRAIAVQVETSKVTIMGMAAWFFTEVAIAAALTFVSLGTSNLLSLGLMAILRQAIPKVLRHLLWSVVQGAVMMGGLNVAAQVVGIAKETRRDGFNVGELGVNVALGALGGLIGFGVNKAFMRGVGKAFGKKAAASFTAAVIGGGVNNVVTSIVMMPIAAKITGAKGGHLTWEVLTSGMAFGASGWARGMAPGVTVLKINPVKIPKMFNNSVIRIKTNHDGGGGGGADGSGPLLGSGTREFRNVGKQEQGQGQGQGRGAWDVGSVDTTSTSDSGSSSGSGGSRGDGDAGAGIMVTTETVTTVTSADPFASNTGDTPTPGSQSGETPAGTVSRPETVVVPETVGIPDVNTGTGTGSRSVEGAGEQVLQNTAPEGAGRPVESVSSTPETTAPATAPDPVQVAERVSVGQEATATAGAGSPDPVVVERNMSPESVVAERSVGVPGDGQVPSSGDTVPQSTESQQTGSANDVTAPGATREGAAGEGQSRVESAKPTLSSESRSVPSIDDVLSGAASQSQSQSQSQSVEPPFVAPVVAPDGQGTGVSVSQTGPVSRGVDGQLPTSPLSQGSGPGVPGTGPASGPAPVRAAETGTNNTSPNPNTVVSPKGAVSGAVRPETVVSGSGSSSPSVSSPGVRSAASAGGGESPSPGSSSSGQRPQNMTVSAETTASASSVVKPSPSSGASKADAGGEGPGGPSDRSSSLEAPDTAVFEKYSKALVEGRVADAEALKPQAEAAVQAYDVWLDGAIARLKGDTDGPGVVSPEIPVYGEYREAVAEGRMDDALVLRERAEAELEAYGEWLDSLAETTDSKTTDNATEASGAGVLPENKGVGDAAGDGPSDRARPRGAGHRSEDSGYESGGEGGKDTTGSATADASSESSVLFPDVPSHAPGTRGDAGGTPEPVSPTPETSAEDTSLSDGLPESVVEFPDVPVHEPVMVEDAPGPSVSAGDVVREALTRTLERDPDLRGLAEKASSAAEVYGSLSEADRVRFEYGLRENGVGDAAVELVRGVLREFPELRGSADADKPVAGLWEVLSSAQRVKFEALLREGVFGETGVDAARALAADGVLGRALAEHGGTVKDLLPTQDVSKPLSEVQADVLLEQRLAKLRDGLTPEEHAVYQDLTDSAVARGDAEKAEAVAKVREAHVARLEAVGQELAFRQSRRAGDGDAGSEQLPLDIVAAAKERAGQAGVKDPVWDGIEALIDKALADGLVKEAGDLIADRNQMVEDLTSASDDSAESVPESQAKAEIAERLAKLGENDAETLVDADGDVVVSSAVLEGRASDAGMSPQEFAGYQQRLEAAVGKGDLEAAAVIVQERRARIDLLDAVLQEIVFRQNQGDGDGLPVADGGPEQWPLDMVAAVKQRAADAGVREAVSDGFEAGIRKAVAEGDIADAHQLIMERDRIVDLTEKASAEQDAELADRLARLREDAPDTDTPDPDGLESPEGLGGSHQAGVEQVEAARAEVEFRQSRSGDETAQTTPEQVPLDVISAAKQRAKDADLPEVWERFETLINRALAEGRVADAQELIVERNQIVEGLQPSVPSKAGGSDSVLVSARDVQVLESLVIRSRTAQMPEGELQGWQERFEQALRQGPEQVGELGRIWHEHLENVTGGSRPGLDALLDADGVLSVGTAQEALANAASDAGVPMVEHATWMTQIREAWASGHTEHAAALVERFWTRIEEAHAEKSASLELELLQAKAGLRDMSVEEFWAVKEQVDTAETTLREGLEKTLQDVADGRFEQTGPLRDKLQSLVDALPEDTLLPSRLGEGVKEILDAGDAETPVHRLREDVRSLLEDTSGEWDSLVSLLDGAETEVRIARTEALDGVPQDDAVWAMGLKESHTHHSGEQGMPEGEIAYWNTKLDEALAAGDREAAVAVARDWHFRYKQFETVETLTGEARDAGQDTGRRSDWQERLSGALRRENLAEFTTLEARWRLEIAAAKTESEFWQSVDDTAGGLKDKAERIGMTEEEWASFEERIVKARTDGNIPELMRAVGERAEVLNGLETVYDAQLAEQLNSLRDGQDGGQAAEIDAYDQALAPEWKTTVDDGSEQVVQEGELWGLFEEKKPDSLRNKFTDPAGDPLRDLDNNDHDGDGSGAGQDRDFQRRLDKLQRDLFGEARRLNMTPDELDLWQQRLDTADDPIVVREELAQRIDFELQPAKETDSRLKSLAEAQRKELIELGFSPHELNAHELGMDAAAGRGDTDMALQLKEAFDAKADAKRLQLTHPDPDPVTPEPTAPGENVLQRTRDEQTPEPTTPPTPDEVFEQLFDPQRTEDPDPLDAVLDTAAKNHDLLPSQLKQQLDDLVTEAKHLQNRALELDFRLDTTRIDDLSQTVTDARNTGRLGDAQRTVEELRDIVTVTVTVAVAVAVAEEASNTLFPQGDQPRTPDPDLRDSDPTAGRQLKHDPQTPALHIPHVLPVQPTEEPKEQPTGLLPTQVFTTPKQAETDTPATSKSIADILGGVTAQPPQETTDDTTNETTDTDEFFDALETQEDAPDNAVTGPQAPAGRTVDSISLPDPDDLQALLNETDNTDNTDNTHETPQVQTPSRPEVHPEFADTGVEGYARRFHKGTGHNIQELWDVASLVVAAGRPDITVDSTLGPDELREANPSHYQEVIKTAQQLNPLLTSADRQTVVAGAASAPNSRVSWPAPPRPLTVGPRLQELRDEVDRFRYDKSKQLATAYERASTVLLLSLARTPDGQPLYRAQFTAHLAPDVAAGYAAMWLLGMLRAVGALSDEQPGTDDKPVMTPDQLGQVMALKDRPGVDGKTLKPSFAAGQIWPKSLVPRRLYVVAGVWDAMDWSVGLFKKLADAVVEIALDRRRNHLPEDAAAIADLIWRDDRALKDQVVVVQAILQKRRAELGEDPDPQAAATEQSSHQTRDTPVTAVQQPSSAPSPVRSSVAPSGSSSDNSPLASRPRTSEVVERRPSAEPRDPAVRPDDANSHTSPSTTQAIGPDSPGRTKTNKPALLADMSPRIGNSLDVEPTDWWYTHLTQDPANRPPDWLSRLTTTLDVPGITAYAHTLDTHPHDPQHTQAMTAAYTFVRQHIVAPTTTTGTWRDLPDTAPDLYWATLTIAHYLTHLADPTHDTQAEARRRLEHIRQAAGLHYRLDGANPHHLPPDTPHRPSLEHRLYTGEDLFTGRDPATVQRLHQHLLATSPRYHQDFHDAVRLLQDGGIREMLTAFLTAQNIHPNTATLWTTLAHTQPPHPTTTGGSTGVNVDDLMLFETLTQDTDPVMLPGSTGQQTGTPTHNDDVTGPLPHRTDISQPLPELDDLLLGFGTDLNQPLPFPSDISQPATETDNSFGNSFFEGDYFTQLLNDLTFGNSSLTSALFGPTSVELALTQDDVDNPSPSQAGQTTGTGVTGSSLEMTLDEVDTYADLPVFTERLIDTDLTGDSLTGTVLESRPPAGSDNADTNGVDGSYDAQALGQGNGTAEEVPTISRTGKGKQPATGDSDSDSDDDTSGNLLFNTGPFVFNDWPIEETEEQEEDDEELAFVRAGFHTVVEASPHHPNDTASPGIPDTGTSPSHQPSHDHNPQPQDDSHTNRLDDPLRHRQEPSPEDTTGETATAGVWQVYLDELLHTPGSQREEEGRGRAVQTLRDLIEDTAFGGPLHDDIAAAHPILLQHSPAYLTHFTTFQHADITHHTDTNVDMGTGADAETGEGPTVTGPVPDAALRDYWTTLITRPTTPTSTPGQHTTPPDTHDTPADDDALQTEEDDTPGPTAGIDDSDEDVQPPAWERYMDAAATRPDGDVTQQLRRTLRGLIDGTVTLDRPTHNLLRKLPGYSDDAKAFISAYDEVKDQDDNARAIHLSFTGAHLGLAPEQQAYWTDALDKRTARERARAQTETATGPARAPRTHPLPDEDSEQHTGAPDRKRQRTREITRQDWDDYLATPEVREARLRQMQQRFTHAHNVLGRFRAYADYVASINALATRDSTPGWHLTEEALALYRHWIKILAHTPHGLNRTPTELGDMLNPAEPLTKHTINQLLTDTAYTLGPRTHTPGHTTHGQSQTVTVEQALTDAGLPLHTTDNPQELTPTGLFLLSHWANHLTTTHTQTTPHTPDTAHTTARTIAGQLANNPDPYIPSLTQRLLPPTTRKPTTTKPTPAESLRRDVPVTPVPWPQPPAPLTIGPELQKLRDTTDAFIYKPEELRTAGDHAGAALLISLKRTLKDAPLVRQQYIEKLTSGLSDDLARMRLLGMFQAAGTFIEQRRGATVMNPTQLRDVIILKEWPGIDGQYTTSYAAALKLWGRSLSANRSYVVDGVWKMTNWNDGGVLQLLADAVTEIAIDLKRNNLPLDERFIAGLIWRDNRAIEDQTVIIHAILLARGVIQQPWPEPQKPLTIGPRLQLLRDTVDQFRHDEHERLATDGDRVRATLLISLKRTLKDAPLVRQKYIEKLTSGLPDDLARMQLLGMFQAAGAFIGQGPSGGVTVMNPTQLRDVIILKEWPGIDEQHNRPRAAALQIWIRSLSANRSYVVDGVWKMTNWNDGGVLPLADAVTEIAIDLKRNNLPLDERFIAGLIWRDNRAIEDQTVIIHAILLARGVINARVDPRLRKILPRI